MAIRARRLSAVAKATEIGTKRLERANSRKAQIAAKDARSGKTKRPVPEKKKSHKKAKKDKSTKAARKASTKLQNAALDTAIGHNQYAKMYATKGVHRRHGLLYWAKLGCLPSQIIHTVDKIPIYSRVGDTVT